MTKKTKNKSNHKYQNKFVIGIVGLLVLISAALIIGHYAFWWFTPAFSQRNAFQSFYGDITSSNLEKAYLQTSSAFKANNSFASFENTYGLLQGDKLSIDYTSYVVKDKTVTIGAIINNSTSKYTFYSSIRFVNGNSVDVIVAIKS
jgi:hypothetical protein